MRILQLTWQFSFRFVATNNPMSQDPDPPWSGITFIILYALHLDNVGSFLCACLCTKILNCCLLPLMITSMIFPIFLGRGFISIPETVSSFLLGMEAHPNPACFPRAMVTCLSSANHLLSLPRHVFVYHFPLVLPQSSCSMISQIILL